MISCVDTPSSNNKAINLVGAKRRDDVSEGIVYDTNEVCVKSVYKRRERTEERGKNVKKYKSE